MYHDYFVTHRAMQVQRLRERSEGNRIAIPERSERGDCSREEARLCRTIDQICKLPLGGKKKAGPLGRIGLPAIWKSWGVNRSADEGTTTLTPAQQAVVIDFERQLVRLRLHDHDHTAAFAARIVDALLADYEYFSGFKPILQHSDEFAYECLYPTWLTVFTALNSKKSADAPVSFDIQQQRTIFEFLDAWVGAEEPGEAEVAALITLIAHRFDPPESHTLVQRLIDLAFDDDGDFCPDHLRPLFQLRESILAAPELRHAIKCDLLLRTALRSSSRQTHYRITPATISRPDLPKVVLDQLFGDDAESDEERLTMKSQVAAILEQADGFDTSYLALLKRHPTQFAELLELVSPRDASEKVLRKHGQRLIAEIVAREFSEGHTINCQALLPFARHLAPRLNQIGRGTEQFLIGEFVRKDANRRVLLDCSQSEAKRRQVAKKLVSMAQNTKKADAILPLLAISAAFNPDDADSYLEAIQRSIVVLELAQSDQSIGKREWDDLIRDIQTKLPDSIDALARPLEAATRQSDRLAKLYLALYEESQILLTTGQISNFGLTRASYSNLSKLVEDEG